MSHFLDYAGVNRRTTGPLTSCLIFSAACLPILAVATLTFALIWHSMYGGEFRRTWLVLGVHCAGAGLLGLFTLWLAVVVRASFGLPGVRSVAWSSAAGAGYGLMPPPAFALAEGLDWLGGEVFVVGLIVVSLVIPILLALWLTSSRKRRTWGFFAATGICASAHFVTTITCVFLARVFDENVNYPWRQIGAAIQRVAVLLLLPLQPDFNGQAPRPAVTGAWVANSMAWGLVIAMIYRAIARRSAARGIQ